MKDLYTVLGVARDADQAAIRKAFKALARTWHPDVNKAAEAEGRFKEISAAHEVLGDDQRRQLYDEFGDASLHSGFDADRARAYRGMGGGMGGGGGGMPGFGSGAGVNLDDVLGGLFGRGGGRPPPRERAGADVQGRMRVSFLDTVRGGEVPIEIVRPTRCTTCEGEGGTGRQPCKSCKGKGRRLIPGMGGNFAMPCDECGGTGVTWADECARCAGTGRTRERRTVNVRVPAGVTTGQTLRLRGQGGEGPHGAPAGDLLLTVEAMDHAFLRRVGKDLEMDLPIRLGEAMEGAAVEVPTPTGRVRVRIPSGSANGQRLRVKGRGVQEREAPGDLFLVLRPVLPPPDPEAIELAHKLDALAPDDPRAAITL